MSRDERFQFEPTYPPGEEPSEGDFEEVEEDETEGRTRIEKRGVVGFAAIACLWRQMTDVIAVK